MDEIVDFEKFNQYAIVHHSTTIEGSTLTETEVQLLLEEGITPKGKPLAHSLMNIDHLNALKFVVQSAKEKLRVSQDLIRRINAWVMKQTGSIYQTALGTVDASKGEYRKGNVRAGNSYFVNYDKVPAMVENLCLSINQKLQEPLSITDSLYLSFDAHFDLVSIHPFYDGNGRTSRLLMNFLQAYHNLPMGIVFKEEKAAYFEALVATREKENIEIFRNFMMGQYERFLLQEMEYFSKAQKMNRSGGGFSLVF
jgi:Fic family protein